jgi:hypothetical protein
MRGTSQLQDASETGGETQPPETAANTSTTENEAGMTTATTDEPPRTADALAERVFAAANEASYLAAIHIGRELGLYAALRDGGPATSTALAQRTGTDERYAREWLEHQAVGGLIAVENGTAGALEQITCGYSVLFCLPTARDERPSAATGTAIRPHTLERYATEAGFSRVEVLPIENDIWRFYALTP